ncbi:hypothetical protein [Paraburkholderia xenovorans]|uniref:hypothetical protein n=1 Tax=Paraburkholderia xenovorans TaxID=36873 RepID=UPI0038B91E7A
MLIPASAGVQPPEEPIPTHPVSEPTASKPAGDDNGNFIRMLSLDEWSEMAGGLYRFGSPTNRLLQGEKLRKAARMKSIWWRRLLKGAENLKGNRGDWCGYVSTMDLDEMTVEIMDDNKRCPSWHSYDKTR